MIFLFISLNMYFERSKEPSHRVPTTYMFRLKNNKIIFNQALLFRGPQMWTNRPVTNCTTDIPIDNHMIDGTTTRIKADSHFSGQLCTNTHNDLGIHCQLCS